MKLSGCHEMKNKLFIALLIIAGFWGFTSVSGKSDPCVNTYVDFGSLDHSKQIIGCVPVNGEEIALDILAKSGLSLEGTKKYGLKVVCRVNKLPSLAVEPCETMPPEDAYWAVIVKRHSRIPDPLSIQNKWNWADKGVSEVYLKAGDSIGLVYTEKGKIKWPS